MSQAVSWNFLGARMLCLLTVPFIVGCGPSDAPRLIQATGVVRLNGKALTNVGVTFFPTASGPMAIGKTNEKGEFIMMTTKPGDGACVGTHQDTIGAAQEGVSEYASAAPIPQKYAMPTTSGLILEVKDGQANNFQLEIGK